MISIDIPNLRNVDLPNSFHSVMKSTFNSIKCTLIHIRRFFFTNSVIPNKNVSFRLHSINCIISFSNKTS